MTALTPQHMRDLADDAEKLTGDSDYDYVFIVTVMKTLRNAADQLEAVQEALEKQEAAGINVVFTDVVRAILTADTTPQDAL